MNTVSDEPRTLWAAIASHPAVGAQTLRRLHERFGEPAHVLGATSNELERAGVESGARQQILDLNAPAIDRTWEQLGELGIDFLWFEDEEFPPLLRELPDAPACLYRIGAALVPGAALAVVGSRKPTPYGRQVARELVEPLAREGVTIVSGLAFGIDAIAHQATLDAGGTTIAVLANGLDDIYPTNHRALGREIVAKGGTLISEFPPGTPPLRHLFPVRNRIIAGLSLGTLVVEAALESGSLITAKLALDYNREVFAVPGAITNPMSEGPHGLIRLGATLVSSHEDILSAFHLEPRHEPPPVTADSQVEAVLLPLLGREAVPLDELIRASRLDAATVSSALMLMEMKGKVRNLGAQRYVLGR